MPHKDNKRRDKRIPASDPDRVGEEAAAFFATMTLDWEVAGD